MRVDSCESFCQLSSTIRHQLGQNKRKLSLTRMENLRTFKGDKSFRSNQGDSLYSHQLSSLFSLCFRVTHGLFNTVAPLCGDFVSLNGLLSGTVGGYHVL